MSEHTPEPWGILKAGNQWGICPVNSRGKPRDGRETEDICGGSIYDENYEANTRLLVVAPELLASLKEMVAGLLATASLGLNEGEVARLKRAEAVIAKATGAKS